jgi:pimeloyl-ACP methyl ester carboxylesterase
MHRGPARFCPGVDVVLIPGLWLNGASWDEVAAPLREAGHTVHALTLPGLESRDADCTEITLRARGGRCPSGSHRRRRLPRRRTARRRRRENDEFPAVNGDVPLPDWSEFGKEELVDLDEERRARLRSIAIPSPVHVARDQQVLRDPRRYDVPATVITCEFSSDLMRKWLSEGHPFMAELGKVKDYELVDLPTGHWPQITRPTELAGGFPAQRSVGREGFEPP